MKRYIKSALAPAAALLISLASTSCLNDLDKEPISPKIDLNVNNDGLLNKCYANFGINGNGSGSNSDDDPDVKGFNDPGMTGLVRAMFNMNELPTDEATCSWGDGLQELNSVISLMSVMAAAGVLTLAGCSNSSGSTAASGTAASVAPAAGDQLSNIQSSGKLIVALEGAWQPWSFHDESDTLVGYDVEVSRAIAEKLGVEPEYVESDWDSLFAGLDAGRYDIVCNGVEVTDERAKTYDFTEPYGYIHTALAVRKDNDEITSFEDLKGKTTANSLASTYMELAESYGATVQGIDTLEETIQLLTAGRIDATLNADVSFYDYLNVHPDADFKLVAQTEDASDRKSTRLNSSHTDISRMPSSA